MVLQLYFYFAAFILCGTSVAVHGRNALLFGNRRHTGDYSFHAFGVTQHFVQLRFSEVRDEQQRKKGRDVVKTTINVVFFDVLMCVFLLLYGLVIIVLSDGDYTWLHIDITLLKVIISAVSYYVFSIIMLNLLLVVKQISRIIEFNLIVKKKTE